MTLLARSLQIHSRMAGAAICLAGVAVAAAGALTGPNMPLRILYPIPVIMAAWAGYLPLGVVLAVGLPIARGLFEGYLWGSSIPPVTTVLNAVISITMLLAFAVITATAATALRRVSTLEGILPICSVCKRIRENQTKWQRLDIYVTEHSEARFSPVMCPDCLRRVYGSPLHG